MLYAITWNKCCCISNWISVRIFLSVLWHCWFNLVGRQEGHPTCKKTWVLVCWWWHFDCSFARLIAPVVTTYSITPSSNKIQNGDILVSANPGSPGKWPLKRCIQIHPSRREQSTVPIWWPNVSTTFWVRPHVRQDDDWVKMHLSRD